MSDLDKIKKAYADMIGFVPAKIEKRLDLSDRIDPETLDLIEAWRLKALTPDALDEKTVQLICVTVLLAQKSAAAKNHMHAARKAGASIDEVHACAALASLFAGIGAFNHAGEIIAEVYELD